MEEKIGFAQYIIVASDDEKGRILHIYGDLAGTIDMRMITRLEFILQKLTVPNKKEILSAMRQNKAKNSLLD